MSETEKLRCARCGKRIKKGGLSYRIKAELISHFDGYIAQNQKETMSEFLTRLDTDLEGLSEEQLEKQIYHKIEYIACPACRDEIEDFLKTEDEA